MPKVLGAAHERHRQRRPARFAGVPSFVTVMLLISPGARRAPKSFAVAGHLSEVVLLGRSRQSC